MENNEMATKVKALKSGPIPKDPQDIHKPVVHYVMVKELEEFGGGKGKAALERGTMYARAFARKAFRDQLEKIRAGKAKPGKF